MKSQAKSGEKYIHVFWYIVVLVLKLLLIKKILDRASQAVPLLLVVLDT